MVFKRDDEQVEWEDDYVDRLTSFKEMVDIRLEWLKEMRAKNGDGEEVIGGDGSLASLTPGNTNEEKVWNFFAEKQLTEAGIAGIMGNFQVESGMDPTRRQTGGPAIGLAQWEPPRWSMLEKWAASEGRDKWDLDTQLQFAWNEMTGGPGADPYEKVSLDRYGGVEFFQTTDDYKEAVNRFLQGFERAGIPHTSRRYDAAKSILDKFGTGTAGQVASAVSIPEGPGNANMPNGLQAAQIQGNKVSIPSGNRGQYIRAMNSYRRQQGQSGLQKLDSDKFTKNLAGCTMLVAPEYYPIILLIYNTLNRSGILSNSNGKMLVNSTYRPGDDGAHGWGGAIDIGTRGRKHAVQVADACWGLGIRAVAIGGNLSGGAGFVHVDIAPGAQWNYNGLPTYRGPGTF